MAKTADRKLEIAKRLLSIASTRHGLPARDLLFDPLTFTICTGNEDDRKLGVETLRGIELIHREFPEAGIILGLSNISFGLKPAARHILNSVFLYHAQLAGLTAAIVHAAKIMPLNRIDPVARQVAEDLDLRPAPRGLRPAAPVDRAHPGHRRGEEARPALAPRRRAAEAAGSSTATASACRKTSTRR